jgi:4-hydroxythreonine-4-phosphate dehydrogenase
MDAAPPVIALTPGEPAGVGPELLVKAAHTSARACLVAVCDPRLVERAAAQLRLPIAIRAFDGSAHEPGELQVIGVTAPELPPPGQPTPRTARYVLETLDIATDGCLAGRFQAMVTGPVQKSVINDGGIPFTGHTEYIAGRCGDGFPVMMLAATGLRVALYSTHLPLSEVAGSLRGERLERVIRTIHRDLVTRFGIPRPRIAVCGLNPHAGEGGHLGREEIDIIEPVLERLRGEGLDLPGPLPADTAFTRHALEGVDTVLAMYHDQGLPVVKHVGFGEVVNITLGLPIVRTSVDHGTALDLAGSGRARPDSLLKAIQTAIELTAPANG